MELLTFNPCPLAEYCGQCASYSPSPRLKDQGICLRLSDVAGPTPAVLASGPCIYETPSRAISTTAQQERLQAVQASHQQYLDAAKHAHETVASWPKWKQDALRLSKV